LSTKIRMRSNDSKL